MNFDSAPLRHLTPRCLLAAGAGFLCSASLLLLSAAAKLWERLLWERLPECCGTDPFGSLWIFVTLTLTGLLVALTVRFFPGHAGPDPATVSLIDKPLPVLAVPGLLLAVVLMLGGGVSLGPENPIMGINIALAVFLGGRLFSGIPAKEWASISVAGTVGAMFGTPLAVVVLLAESSGNETDTPLWNRLLLPLLAAGTGALTTWSLVDCDLSLAITPYPGFQLLDLVSGTIIVIFATFIGLAFARVFPWLHRLFARLGSQSRMILCGGVLLGLLGAFGGEPTLFKGLDQMKHLAAHAGEYSFLNLILIVAVKSVALLIAASCGFRGGRIFPAWFIGVALGFAIHDLVPAVPLSLAVGAATVGILLPVVRHGLLTLFLAAILTPDPTLISLLCVLMLPAWILVRNQPPMLVSTDEAVRSP